MTTTSLSPKQILSIQRSGARVNVWVGSIRAGKTMASLLRFLIAVAAAPRGGEIVISGRTRDTIFRNVIGPLQDTSIFGSIAKRVTYNRGAPTAMILGRRVHIIGASDAKAENIVRGMTVVLWYCDEATVHPEGFITQMLGRMSPPGATAYMTTNPDAPQHWFKKKFLDRAKELKWRVFKFKLDDNPSLTAEYVAAIKAEFTGMWYKRYIEGEWAMAEGAIWDSFNEELHLLKPATPDESYPEMLHRLGVHITRRVVGIDYGTTNATAAIMLGLGTDGKLYVLDEWRHDSRAGQIKWTDARLSKGIKEWLAENDAVWGDGDKRWMENIPGGSRNLAPAGFVNGVEWVAVDPSAASFRLQLWNDGVMNVISAENSVVSGLRQVASLFAIGSLKILNAPGLVDEIPGYVWDDKATDKGEDQPVKLNDHSCDGLRYAVACAMSLWSNEIEVTYAAA